MICRGITFSYGDVRIVGNHCGGVSGYCWSNLGSIALFDIANGVTDSYIVGRRGSLRTRVRACQVVPEIYHHSATWMRVSDLCTPETVAAVYFTGGLVWSFWARCHNRDVLISCGGTIRSLFSVLYNRGYFFHFAIEHYLTYFKWTHLEVAPACPLLPKRKWHTKFSVFWWNQICPFPALSFSPSSCRQRSHWTWLSLDLDFPESLVPWGVKLLQISQPRHPNVWGFLRSNL